MLQTCRSFTVFISSSLLWFIYFYVQVSSPPDSIFNIKNNSYINKRLSCVLPLSVRACAQALLLGSFLKNLINRVVLLKKSFLSILLTKWKEKLHHYIAVEERCVFYCFSWLHMRKCVCLHFSLFTTILLEVRCEEQCMPVIKARVSQYQQRERKRLLVQAVHVSTQTGFEMETHLPNLSPHIFFSLTHTNTHNTAAFFVLSNHFIKKRPVITNTQNLTSKG